MLLTTISNMFVHNLIVLNYEQVANAKYCNTKLESSENFSFMLTVNEKDKVLQVLFGFLSIPGQLILGK